jgi:hypothetical protein
MAAMVSMQATVEIQVAVAMRAVEVKALSMKTLPMVRIHKTKVTASVTVFLLKHQ